MPVPPAVWHAAATVAEQCQQLPPKYRVLNDGPGREVLAHDDWEECPVFPTVAEAIAYAWGIERPER